MTMTFKSAWSTFVMTTLACLSALVACSEDNSSSSGGSAGTTAGSGGAGGASSGGTSSGGTSSGGTSSGGTSSGGTSTGGSSTGGSSTGGSSGSGGAGGGSGGTAASGGSAGAGTGGAGGSAGTGGATDGGPPPPADGGQSIYSVQCSGNSAPCGFPSAHCLGIDIGDGGVGFTCSNHCTTNADCSTAPTGAEAQAGCVPFAERSRCVLVCNNNGARFDCPTGMSCYTYPGSFLGYCLWI
jgi:hypothetical protein